MSKKPIHLEILKRLRAKESPETLKKAYPYKKIFLYLGRVYDTGWYVHPGGQWIFEELRCKNTQITP